ncbi:MAG: cysteine--tRNA ligase [Candidatus Kaiserbacteria bacterium]|nr:cysteine--tRNA ligase [Candidatus Kaiserbacteria bacterium]
MRKLRLYNTETRKKETLQPHDGTRTVRIYSCGPTLYQQAHIGNMRAYVFADTLNRTLRLFDYRPKHVINFTDVGHLTDDADAGEDKVEKQAKQENMDAKTITKKNGKIFLADLKKLHIATKRYRFPWATQHIQEQIAIVRELEKKGYTYEIDDGVYFDTQAYRSYGKLGLSAVDEKTSQARVQEVAGKKHFCDFALWKKTPAGVSRQQEWDSPWGRGFPGWHIECSAMAMKILGETIDIHTGGVDHITVHHNNEIAQSEAMTEKPFAKIWMHTAFLTVQNEKLSKSLGNTYTIADLEDRGFDPVALRLLFLQSSYRTPASFSFESLGAAQTALDRLRRDYERIPRPVTSLLQRSRDRRYTDAIDKAIANDLNTPQVLAVMHDIIKDTTLAPAVKRNTVRYADQVLGILGSKKKKRQNVPAAVLQLAKERDVARSQKAYDKADAIRKEIDDLGYDVADTETGTSVTKRVSV